MNNFKKDAKTIDDLYDLLVKRWLGVDDTTEEEIKKDLNNIWYFRLTGYFKDFQDKDDIFSEWTTFKKVLDHYIFDRKLRLLTFDAIEKIEISVKSIINNYMSLEYWKFWYTNKSLFNLITKENQDTYDRFLVKVDNINEKQKSIFIKEYFENNKSEKYLPSWMLMEELTIWEISTIYYLLEFVIKEKISEPYDVYAKDFWIRLNLLTTLRNISAHHSRLRNRKYITKLKMKDVKFKNIFQKRHNEKKTKLEVNPNYFNSLLIIFYLLNKINKNFGWLDDLNGLITKYNWIVDIKKMWLSPIWKKEIESFIKNT